MFVQAEITLTELLAYSFIASFSPPTCDGDLDNEDKQNKFVKLYNKNWRRRKILTQMICTVLINFQIILLGYQLYLPTVGYYNNILILLMSMWFHCFLMNPLTELLSYLFPCYQHIYPAPTYCTSSRCSSFTQTWKMYLASLALIG